MRSSRYPGPSTRAFSLVELSIVLVILGLLVGGVLSGQSLIRAAELRSVASDLARYQVAFLSFRDKYTALPGDMTNATAFWGSNATDCSNASTDKTPGTCNGDGDGIIEAATTDGGTAEMFQLWKQLALAGLIEGSYTGTSGAGAKQSAVIGTNVPSNRIRNAGANVVNWDNSTDTTEANNYAIDYGNHITFGEANPPIGTNKAFLKSEELWNIDTKLDDGKPGLGKLIAIYWNPCTLSTNATDFTKDYELTNTGKVCAIRYMNIGL